jgi:predicted metal-dependent hydrolase
MAGTMARDARPENRPRPEATGKTGVPSQARQKPERPRDRLGRPLAWDAVNELELDDYDANTAEQTHELGRAAIRSARYFPAHEAWETAWKQSRGTGDEEFFKGLSQMGAGYVHVQRGNVHGAITLLERAVGRVERYPDPHRGIATAALTARLRADAERVRSGELVPGADATFEPPEV